MERHPAYYEKHNKTTGGPDMKMLKKLAALILAAIPPRAPRLRRKIR